MGAKLFKIIVSTDRTDYILTNDLRPHTVEFIAKMQKIRLNTLQSFFKKLSLNKF